jgi:hypothetical protein
MEEVNDCSPLVFREIRYLKNICEDYSSHNFNFSKQKRKYKYRTESALLHIARNGGSSLSIDTEGWRAEYIVHPLY